MTEEAQDHSARWPKRHSEGLLVNLPLQDQGAGSAGAPSGPLLAPLRCGPRALDRTTSARHFVQRRETRTLEMTRVKVLFLEVVPRPH